MKGRSTDPSVSSAQRAMPMPQGRPGPAFHAAWVDWGAGGLLLIVGGAILLAVTPYGSGLLGDSYAYLASSDNLARGISFGLISGGGNFKPLTQYPPFYPLLLSLLQRAGLGSLESARWLNAVCFGGLAALAYAAVRMGGSARGFALLTGLLFLASPILLEMSSWAMSEPLFLVLMLGSLMVLARFLQVGSRSSLWFAGGLMGAAALTRYAGLALPVAGVAILAWARRRRPGWAGEVGSLAVLGAGPCLWWIVHNALLVGNPVNRRLLWEPPGWPELKAAVLNGLAWFFPKVWIRGQWLALVLLLILVAFAALLLWARRRSPSDASPMADAPIDVALGVWAVVYLAFIGAARTFADPRIPVDQRLLSPVYVAVVILGVILVASFGSLGRWARSGSWLMGGWLLVSYVAQAIPVTHRLSREGQGLAHRAWAQSPVMQAVRALPWATVLYTNEIPALYFHTGRNAFSIPWRIDSITGDALPEYSIDLERMRMRMEQGAVLVLFSPQDLFPEQASLEDMTAGMVLVAQFPQGALYTGVGEAGHLPGIRHAAFLAQRTPSKLPDTIVPVTPGMEAGAGSPQESAP